MIIQIQIAPVYVSLNINVTVTNKMQSTYTKHW